MATETVPMDDRSLFEAATSPEPVQEVAQEPAVETASGEQPRDEQGRFATKEPETETPQPETTPQPEIKDEPQGSIPPWRLTEVTQERNAERQRREAAERQALELQAQMRALQQQIKPAEQPQPPDWYEKPADAMLHTIAPHLQQIQSAHHYNSRLIAGQVHGAEHVDAAEKAFTQAEAAGMIDPLEATRVLKSPNIYDAAVRWYKDQQTRQKIGGDLDGFLKKRDEELLADPNFLARAAEKIRSQNGQGKGPAPVVQLPPSLNRATSAANNKLDDVGDMSDASLFRQAMAP